MINKINPTKDKLTNNNLINFSIKDPNLSITSSFMKEIRDLRNPLIESKDIRDKSSTPRQKNSTDKDYLKNGSTGKGVGFN